MKPINKVFLDMDGVIVDFIRGVSQHHNLPIDLNELTYWNAVMDVLGMTEDDFWYGMDDDFWYGLEKTEEADRIIAMLQHLDVCLLTAPAQTGIGGRQRWIKDNTPQFYSKYLIGPAKEFCASYDSILIDDSLSNVEKFYKAGGNAILYPQPWNCKVSLSIPEKMQFLSTALIAVAQNDGIMLIYPERKDNTHKIPVLPRMGS